MAWHRQRSTGWRSKSSARTRRKKRCAAVPCGNKRRITLYVLNSPSRPKHILRAWPWQVGVPDLLRFYRRNGLGCPAGVNDCALPTAFRTVSEHQRAPCGQRTARINRLSACCWWHDWFRAWPALPRWQRIVWPCWIARWPNHVRWHVWRPVANVPATWQTLAWMAALAWQSLAWMAAATWQGVAWMAATGFNSKARINWPAIHECE